MEICIILYFYDLGAAQSWFLMDIFRMLFFIADENLLRE